MSTPGLAPGVFGYPESRTGAIAVGLVPAAVACVIEHERSVLVGLTFLPGLILNHLATNGVCERRIPRKEVSS